MTVDINQWIESPRFLWWNKNIRKIIWAINITYVLGFFLFIIYSIIPTYLITPFVISCIFLAGCFGYFGEWNEEKSPEYCLKGNNIHAIFLIGIEAFVCYMIAHTMEGPWMMMVAICMIGMIMAFLLSLPFYHFYKKFYYEYIPPKLGWGKSESQKNRIRHNFAFHQAFYVFRVCSIYVLVLILWLSSPFIDFPK